MENLWKLKRLHIGLIVICSIFFFSFNAEIFSECLSLYTNWHIFHTGYLFNYEQQIYY